MMKMTKIPKPVNNAIVIKDISSAHWLVEQLSKPISKSRVERTKKSLSSTFELYFKK